jgi:hypothetical protein
MPHDGKVLACWKVGDRGGGRLRGPPGFSVCISKEPVGSCTSGGVPPCTTGPGCGIFLPGLLFGSTARTYTSITMKAVVLIKSAAPSVIHVGVPKNWVAAPYKSTTPRPFR